MGINLLWIRDEPFARSIERNIDRETLVDLLGIVVYEAKRSSQLEDAGFLDQANSTECLFDYVLDALKIPSACETYSREPFEDLFYDDFLLEHKFASLHDVLIALEQLRDEIHNDRVVSLANAKERRANFKAVGIDKISPSGE